MRIFCPATLLLPHCYWAHSLRAGMPPLFICLWFTDPRGRACHPYAHSAAAENRHDRGGDRMRPFGRWSYAPARREPGSRQPEQYALEVGPHPNLWTWATLGFLTPE